jgi:hypothetical protein
MSSVIKPWKTFFTYPATWLAAALITGLHAAFTLVFQPTLPWTLAAFGADMAAAAGWVLFAFKSEGFRKRLNRMPYESQGKDAAALASACPEPFRRQALESINLINKINAEFPDRAYSSELELMLLNIRELAKSHKTLALRAQEFGDAGQKKKMEALLQEQRQAVANALGTLKTFSGNLTLLEADAGQTKSAAGELKDLNDGLKEVISEDVGNG